MSGPLRGPFRFVSSSPRHTDLRPVRRGAYSSQGLWPCSGLRPACRVLVPTPHRSSAYLSCPHSHATQVFGLPVVSSFPRHTGLVLPVVSSFPRHTGLRPACRVLIPAPHRSRPACRVLIPASHRSSTCLSCPHSRDMQAFGGLALRTPNSPATSTTRSSLMRGGFLAGLLWRLWVVGIGCKNNYRRSRHGLLR